MVAAPVAQLGIYGILILAAQSGSNLYPLAPSYMELSTRAEPNHAWRIGSKRNSDLPAQRTLQLYFAKHPLGKINLVAAWFAEILGPMFWAALIIVFVWAELSRRLTGSPGLPLGGALFRRQLQPVADPEFGQDMGRAGRIGFELLPQAADEDAQVLHLLCLRWTPDFTQ